ncbi:MAG: SMI1/KNR4 family protein [Legionella sp.]|nr:SMI1/KNR4 family protein [Legionella sp.]
MFDFSKIGMKPSYPAGYKTAITDEQIAALEQHCGHPLPENYKTILRNYNAGEPEAKYFDVIDKPTGVPLEWKLHKFYHLGEDKITPADIRWLIENYSEYMGPNTLPFADDGEQQIYFMKWIDNIPEVWFLAYEERPEPESFKVLDSFDELLGALYVGD